MSEIIRKIFARYERVYGDDTATAMRDRFEIMRAKTESPIEEVMLALLLELKVGAELKIEPQKYIAGCRVDFALTGGLRNLHIAIECDGYAFHKGAEDGVERDKSRDSRLANLGWTTLRFEGHEIHNDPEAVLWRIKHAVAGYIYKGTLEQRVSRSLAAAAPRPSPELIAIVRAAKETPRARGRSPEVEACLEELTQEAEQVRRALGAN